MPAAVHAMRYPATNSDRRWARVDLIVRAYSDATGATAGSIIAVIMTAHIGRNSCTGRPMVPTPLPMSRAYATTPTHASAARATSVIVVGFRRYAGRAAGTAGAVMPTRRRVR